MTFGQKAAAWAPVQALFAGCSADTGFHSPAAPAPPSIPTQVPTPAPPPAPVAPTISAQPTDVTLLTGATATYSVSAKGSYLTYQWKKNGTAITGATASSYKTPPAIWSDEGAQYTVVVTNSVGSVTSNAAAEHLQLSADQQAAESFSLAPAAGVYLLTWHLDPSTAPSRLANYLGYFYAVGTASPLTSGPQTIVEQGPANLTTTLPTPPAGVERVLKNGGVLVVPATLYSTVTTYVGSSVQIDELAADNKTVAYSELRSNYSVVPLTGLLHSAPDEFTHPNAEIFENTHVLDTTTTWASGAAYLRYTQRNLGDRYDVVDCNATTTGTAPSPCQTNTTLAAAMTAGETSSSDATTYHTSDGTIVMVDGVQIWVANKARPSAAVGAFTTEYRIYYELNGNVYTGHLIKDGAVMGGTSFTSGTTTTYFNYYVRLNGAAVQSLAAGTAGAGI